MMNNRTESLAYLFDPDVENKYRAVYENVQGLVKYDNNGGYVYNSHENYAAFKGLASGELGTNGEPSDGYFEVYDNWALTSGGSPNGQFFPFDGADEVFETNNSGNYKVGDDGKLVPIPNVPLENGTTLNHFMGRRWRRCSFSRRAAGSMRIRPCLSLSPATTMCGLFIDNVLVSDLGGIHDECFTIIDFEQGMVYTGLTPVVQNKEINSFSEDIPTLEELRTGGTDGKTWTWFDRTQDNNGNRVGTKTGSYADFKAAHNITSTTLKDIFTAAEQADTQTWGNESGMSADTFDQNTQHELKMFYLERGAGASNLVLEFNMLAVPASGITKTDQDGRPVSGAEFTLWPAEVSNEEADEYGFSAPIIDEVTGPAILFVFAVQDEGFRRDGAILLDQQLGHPRIRKLIQVPACGNIISHILGKEDIAVIFVAVLVQPGDFSFLRRLQAIRIPDHQGRIDEGKGFIHGAFGGKLGHGV